MAPSATSIMTGLTNQASAPHSMNWPSASTSEVTRETNAPRFCGLVGDRQVVDVGERSDPESVQRVLGRLHHPPIHRAGEEVDDHDDAGRHCGDAVDERRPESGGTVQPLVDGLLDEDGQHPAGRQRHRQDDRIPEPLPKLGALAVPRRSTAMAPDPRPSAARWPPRPTSLAVPFRTGTELLDRGDDSSAGPSVSTGRGRARRKARERASRERCVRDVLTPPPARRRGPSPRSPGGSSTARGAIPRPRCCRRPGTARGRQG